MAPNPPQTSFEVTEAMADLIIGSGTSRNSPYMGEILRCARQSRPRFRHDRFIIALHMSRWMRRAGGGLMTTFPHEDGRRVVGRPFTVRFTPRLDERDLSVVFYDHEDVNPEGFIDGWVLPLGGVFAPQTLMSIEDAISEMLGADVSIPVLAPPIWVPDPWGKMKILQRYQSPRVESLPGGRIRKHHTMHHHGVPLILSRNSATPPTDEAIYVVTGESDEGIFIAYFEDSGNTAVARGAEVRTNERVPEGLNPLVALGLNTDEATEDDVRGAAKKLLEAGPRAGDTIVAELGRVGRQLDLAKELDVAMWRKTIGVSRKWAFDALRQKSQTSSATTEDSSDPDESAEVVQEQEEPFNGIPGLPSLDDAAAVALPGDDQAEGGAATGSDPAADPAVQG